MRDENSNNKKSEEALTTSDDELRTLFGAMSDVIVVLDEDGRYLKIAPTDPTYLYRPQKELIGKTVYQVFSKGDADFFVREVRQALQERRIRRTEYSLNVRGEEVWFEGTVSPMSDGSALWIARDITERKRAEEALRESEDRYRRMFDSNPHPTYVFDKETLRFVATNEAMVNRYGYSREELLSMTISEIRPAEDEEKLRESLAKSSDAIYSGVWRHRKRDGSIIDVEITSYGLMFLGRPSFVVTAQDITERRILEEQVRQTQKMEAIGQLAGGIAHDFNNLLTVINGYTDLALMKISKSGPLRQNLEEIKKASLTASALTRQLLAFGRRQLLQPRPLDLNTVVRELEKMLRRVIGEDIDFLTSLEPNLGSINADPGQIEQVIMNLVVNARDAMPEGGRLTIETANVTVDDDDVRQHIDRASGRYVMLAVTDSGIGMDAQIQERIFEPFFTTKESGKGTGLGLATVYGIIQQSGGYISVYSEPRAGSTFKIYLPRLDKAAAARPRVPTPQEAVRGDETVLITEDDRMVRVMTREILETCGYHVLEADDAAAALQLCEHHPHPIHLLLTDVIMPGINGRELANRATLFRPEIKVLYMSGYANRAIVHQGAFDEGLPFLQKPFAPMSLATKVREVLDFRKKP